MIGKCGRSVRFREAVGCIAAGAGALSLVLASDGLCGSGQRVLVCGGRCDWRVWCASAVWGSDGCIAAGRACCPLALASGGLCVKRGGGCRCVERIAL